MLFLLIIFFISRLKFTLFSFQYSCIVKQLSFYLFKCKIVENKVNKHNISDLLRFFPNCIYQKISFFYNPISVYKLIAMECKKKKSTNFYIFRKDRLVQCSRNFASCNNVYSDFIFLIHILIRVVDFICGTYIYIKCTYSL